MRRRARRRPRAAGCGAPSPIAPGAAGAGPSRSMSVVSAPAAASALFGPRRVPGYRRWSLWALLIALVAALLATLVWLAGRYEASQVQSKLERDTADALGDIRSALTRNVQTLQALQAGHPTRASWSNEADRLLRDQREWVRIEWRDSALGTVAAVDTPYRSPVFARLGRANGRRVSGPAYSSSYFVPQLDGLGLEVMELCLPQVTAGELTGYIVATYSLSEILSGMVGPQLMRSQEISFTEADGTRLAMHGAIRRGARVFT